MDSRGGATYFAGVNRGKRSIVLDLNAAGDRERVVRLASTADVVIENFRPGVMEKYGLDYPALRGANERLIHCTITGFGTGEGAGLPGYDLLVQAVGGLMSVTSPAEGEPYKVGVALVDVITGLNALSGILLTLRTSDVTGVGQKVEVDLLTSLLSGLVNQAASTLATDRPPVRQGTPASSVSTSRS